MFAQCETLQHDLPVFQAGKMYNLLTRRAFPRSAHFLPGSVYQFKNPLGVFVMCSAVKTTGPLGL